MQLTVTVNVFNVFGQTATFWEIIKKICHMYWLINVLSSHYIKDIRSAAQHICTQRVSTKKVTSTYTCAAVDTYQSSI